MQSESGLAKILGSLIALGAGLGLWIAIFSTAFGLGPHR
jgi:hypothetical protein